MTINDQILLDNVLFKTKYYNLQEPPHHFSNNLIYLSLKKNPKTIIFFDKVIQNEFM